LQRQRMRLGQLKADVSLKWGGETDSMQPSQLAFLKRGSGQSHNDFTVYLL
jgi:hypothetical protein